MHHVFSATAAALLLLAASRAAATEGPQRSVELSAGGVRYEVNLNTIAIRARRGGAWMSVMPALGGGWRAERDGAGWRWRDRSGDAVSIHVEADALSVLVTQAAASAWSWNLPNVSARDYWVIPDGEGVAFSAGDPFWRHEYHHQHVHCLHATSGLSFPAWSRMTAHVAITYILGDGLQSALCLYDDNGIQARLTHDFGAGAETVELLIEVDDANPLAPALAYRRYLVRHGLLKTFADKPVPLLSRLFGAQHAYVWGDGRTTQFLEGLHDLGIERMLLAYDQDLRVPEQVAEFLALSHRLGYLAGPYEEFENAQSPPGSDQTVSDWGTELYPAGCVRDSKGAVVIGFANRGCDLSSEALRRRAEPPTPASRYEAHAREGADQVFVDGDAFGNFEDDFSPDHPMTMARDRENRLARLSLGIDRYHFVMGSEKVAAWAHGVAHYSHGTAQAHVDWALLSDHARFGGWWPPGRPAIFFQPISLTADEKRASFGPADRLPLFEAVFHDCVVATDRWEFGLTKVAGLERQRFARALLYGTPTMWSLDQRELARVGPWLKAAHDDFRRAHGWSTPVALTGFEWLTPDRLVQRTTFADGHEVTANLMEASWRGLGSNCVRVAWPGQAAFDLCPPDLAGF